MIKIKKQGFSLVELLIVIAIFAIIIGIPYKMFIKELKTTMQEVGVSKTSMQNIPSLEIIRKDIETAGYGLFRYDNHKNDNITFSYREAKSNTPSLYSFDIDTFNDAPNNCPRAIVGKKDTSKNNFSYLVLKATAFGQSKVANQWSYAYYDNTTDTIKINVWSSNNTANYNNLQKDSKVVVLKVIDKNNMKLITNDTGKFYFVVNKTPTSTDNEIQDCLEDCSIKKKATYVIYGLATKNANPRAPFNRIDYFLDDSQSKPSECAEGTHILYRGIMDKNGNIQKSQPILNCVADFQVKFIMKKYGGIDDLTNYSSKVIREQLKEVKISILMQNGVKDNNYSYDNDSVKVGDRIFKFTDMGIPDYKHYRWSVVEISATPKNLE